jgi:hypothetical protein
MLRILNYCDNHAIINKTEVTVKLKVNTSHLFRMAIQLLRIHHWR